MTPDAATVDVASGEAALTETVGAVEIARDVVLAVGTDAATFLQGQLSTDLAVMADGDSSWTLVLQPQGKIDVHGRVTRRAADDFVLDVDAGWGDRLLERLSRFLLRVDCTLTPVRWQAVALRGPASASVAATAEVDAAVDWPGSVGRDLLGPEVTVGDATWCPPEALEIVRIAAGVARMGSEMDDSTIPAAAGVVAGSVSFTKGCFVGQELVARIDSRGGNTPERLCGVVGDESLMPGAVLRAGGIEVGRVTSAATSPGRGATIALAYIKRAVEPPVDVLVGTDGSDAAVARVVALPIGE
ncbi:MAG: glycine cleavage T C-terminal barrel domain-containing protein [Acidimicrobiales bacterium]